MIVAAWAARLLGRALRGRSSSLYWTANAVVFLVAVGLVVYSSTTTGTSADLVWGAAIGLGFGGLAGLRNGWRVRATAGQGSRP